MVTIFKVDLQAKSYGLIFHGFAITNMYFSDD
jgi:hypothetical protein